ncbi:MAG: hypothetical protein IPP94_15085 [Ignavibacteria bacterium]|nr:hypothetical protein [Ignavibacteria bacterium]
MNARRELRMPEQGDDRVQERPDAVRFHDGMRGTLQEELRVLKLRVPAVPVSVHFRHDALTDHRVASLLLQKNMQ